MVDCWLFKSSHSHVIPEVTTDVVLTCISDGSDNGKKHVDKVSRIRILKMNERINAWETYAMKRNDGVTKLVSSDVIKMRGNIGNNPGSFLSIVWSVASERTVGMYRCEVDGYDPQHGMVIVNDLFITESVGNITAKDLLVMFKELNNESGTIHKQLEEADASVKTLQDKMSTGVEKLRKQHVDDYASFRKKMETLKHDFDTKSMRDFRSKIEDSFYEYRHWPMGPMAMMMPKSGCPKGFERGGLYVNLNTTPFGLPRWSHTSHLEVPYQLMGASFYWYHCVRNTPSAGGIPWPRGKYCFTTGSSNSCPSHFQLSVWTLTSTNRLSQNPFTIFGSKVAYATFASSPAKLTISVCCRNDGDVNIPIRLPFDKAFFMNRCSANFYKVKPIVVELN